MANIRQLLLPYAYDSTGNLVHIDDAHKGETYKCPECGNILSLNISKIPKGQKYHRRNHFSHSKGTPDNQCTESFLHKFFKTRAKECIQKKIDNQETEFKFTWQCDECNQQHQGNMLKKAVSVHLEYDLGICQPDIALLDRNGKVVIVIEVVVTHKPEEKVLKYYTKNKIGCLQIYVSDFEDCENVEKKLMHPNSVNLCPTPNCEFCGHKMHKMKMIIGDDNCWNCGKMTRVAIIKDFLQRETYSPFDFTSNDAKIAIENGANVKRKYSIQLEGTCYANVCEHCGKQGKKYLYNDYLPKQNIKKLDIGYKCHRCIIKKEDKRGNITKINNIEKKETIYAKEKICPDCQCELIIVQNTNGKFYKCGNYPHCRYTENITAEE